MRGDDPLCAVGPLKDLVGAEGHRVVHADLLRSGDAAVGQADADHAGIVELALLVEHGKRIDKDLGAVVKLDRLAGTAGQILHLGQIKRHRAEDHRQQDGQVDQKGAPAAEAVFAEHIALADLFLFAANGRHIQPQLFKARGVEFLGVRKRGGALDLPAGGFERAAQHRGSAHEHAQAQQPHDQDEIPAFENVIEMRAVDKQIGAGIILRVIGQLASLRQQRTEAAAERHGGKQDIGKAHGAQDLKKSFHALFFCTKPPALPGGRHKWLL